MEQEECGMDEDKPASDALGTPEYVLLLTMALVAIPLMILAALWGQISGVFRRVLPARPRGKFDTASPGQLRRE